MDEVAVVTIEPIILLADLATHLGVSGQTVRRAWRAGRMPVPKRLGRRKCGWPISQINSWLLQEKGLEDADQTIPLERDAESLRQ